MLEPNFFIIGAPKAATTSMSSLLALHPEAAMVQHKEPHFFSMDNRYGWGWKAYLSLFTHCVGEKAIGDASTSYSRIRFHPNVVDRIKHHVPNARIIYMVRHPLNRIESAYLEVISQVGNPWFNSVNEGVRQMPTFVDTSRYWEIFDAYRQRFGESRIKVVWFEEYIADQTAVFQDVCRFLEIDDTVVPDLGNQSTNSRDVPLNRLAEMGRDATKINTDLDEETRRTILDQIREDNLRFLSHFGKSKDHWGDLF